MIPSSPSAQAGPLVSVVIPFHDDERFLTDCLGSVLAQTYSNVEVIIVDDGSSEEAAAFARSFTSDRVRYSRRDHAGLSATRNRGVSEARGDVVAFIDADDIWMPHKVEVQLRALSDFEGVVYSTVLHIDESGRELGTSTDFDRFRRRRDRFSGSIHTALLAQNIVHPSTILMPKRLFLEVGGFREQIGPSSDWDFALRLAERYPFVRIDEPLVKILRRADSMGSDPDWLRLDSRRVLDDARTRLRVDGSLDPDVTAALGLGYFASRNMGLAGTTLLRAAVLRPWRLDLWRWLGTALVWRSIRSVIPPAWTRR